MFIMTLILTYVMLGLATAPLRAKWYNRIVRAETKYTDERRSMGKGDALTLSLISIVWWPFHFFFLYLSKFIRYFAFPDERGPSRKAIKAEEQEAAAAAAIAARRTEIDRQLESVKALKERLRESQIDTMADWTRQFVAAGGKAHQVEGSAEHQRRMKAERAAEQRKREMDYQERYGRIYR